MFLDLPRQAIAKNIHGGLSDFMGRLTIAELNNSLFPSVIDLRSINPEFKATDIRSSLSKVQPHILGQHDLFGHMTRPFCL